MQIKKLAVVAGTVGALALTLLTAAPASADYAPGPDDVVGVGSDTVQFAIDFLADGDYTGSTGYNLGQRNRIINFDATPDANARLAYGVNGLNGTTTSDSNCAPGTGGTAGTGNQTSTHTGDRPCGLNPTIVLRAGLKPVQRPNGSGAGYNALKADDVASTHNIDFARASSSRGSNVLYDSVKVGTDGLAMLSATTTNAVALSDTQLKAIYECTKTTWNAAGIDGSSSATIVPILPQVGSGTRSSFLGLIGVTTPGACVVNAEENDAEAVNGNPNAIEPMSSGRLLMYQGKFADGTATGQNGYFTDPSCAYAVTTPTACTTTKVLTPDVTYWTTGTPSSGTLFNSTRTLYVYFRHSDINSTKAFQPGSTRNWLRTMFYNPCSGTNLAGDPITNSGAGANCTGGGTYGPGGAPYLKNNGALLSAAGIDTSNSAIFGAFTASGP
ncbi:MAG: substrate-binding domain-containing protein [Actinomycetes bacterium]